MLDQDGDVLLPLPQGRHPDRQDLQAVVEVLAELPALDQAAQVLVARGDDPHVHLAHGLAADRADLALLQRAQQLLLHVGAHVPDLVEEEGPAVGQLEEALLVALGAGERPADVPEELALEERVGQRGAVLGEERLARPRALRVDGAGDQLLAGARLALDEDGLLGGHDLVEEAQHVAHRGRAPHDRRVGARGLARLAEAVLHLHELLRLGLGPQRELGVQGLELLRPPLVLLVEPRVLDRDRREVGEARQHVQLDGRERALLQAVVHVDGAEDPAPEGERQAEDAADADRVDREELLEPAVLHRVRREDGLPRLEHLLHDAARERLVGVRDVLPLEVPREADLRGLALLPEDQEPALRARELDHVVEDDREEPVEVQLAVERLRDALEAQQPLLVLLRLLDLGREVQHHGVAEVGGGRGRLRGRGLLEPDPRFPDADDVARLQRRAVHQVAVERRAVLAAEVDDDVLGAVALDAAVAAARLQVEHRDVVLEGAADRDDVLVHLEDGASLVLVEDEPGHGGRSSARGDDAGDPARPRGATLPATVRYRTVPGAGPRRSQPVAPDADSLALLPRGAL